MKAIFLKCIAAFMLLTVSEPAHAQCDIQNRLYPDGTMLYYIEPVNFYWTKSRDLKGGIVTDMENFYLELRPTPFPEKPLGHKLKDDLELTLANDTVYKLEHFDTRYVKHDSVMQMLFLIDKKSLEPFLEHEAVSVKINMEGTEGVRTYTFKLHKTAIREQLTCFLKEKEKKKNK